MDNPPAEAPRGIDRSRVDDWLVANVPGATAPFRYDLIAAGGSNLTFRVTDAAGNVWALRWAAGTACVAGTWFCVYTLPGGPAGMPYTDAHVLHVAGAALGVLMATIFIAFD